LLTHDICITYYITLPLLTLTQSLKVFQEGTAHFLNVETNYIGGIAHAKQLYIISSNKANDVVLPYFHQLS
jgi:hypothetical protein